MIIEDDQFTWESIGEAVQRVLADLGCTPSVSNNVIDLAAYRAARSKAAPVTCEIEAEVYGVADHAANPPPLSFTGVS